MAPLATADDLAGRLGREFTPAEEARATLLLADASAVVRGFTGQQFTAGTSTTRLVPRNGAVRLAQRPVTAVTAVADVDGNDLAYTWQGADRVTIDVGVDEWQRNGRYAGPVDVTYDHGYEAVPDDVVAIVCQIAGRAFGRPADETGFTGETVGGYSYTTGAAAAAGPAGMMADEKAVLARYRRVGGVARMDA